MGIISELYALLNEDYNPAMEAEDITKDVTAGAEKAMGEGGNSSGNHDLSLDTDHILTADTGKSTSDEEPEDNNQDTGGDENTPSEEDTPTEGEGETNDIEGGESEEPPVEETQPEDQFSESRKKKIWENYKKFYSILSDAIDLVSKYVPNVSDPETIQTLTNVKNNLVETKEYVFKILTEEFKTMEYPELKKKYIGLNYVYDLCSKQIQKYFDSYDKDNQKKTKNEIKKEKKEDAS